MVLLNIKSKLIDYYIKEDENDVEINTKIVWIYLRIMGLMEKMSKHYDSQVCIDVFIEAFNERLIFVDEEKHVRNLINIGMIENIITTIQMIKSCNKKKQEMKMNDDINENKTKKLSCLERCNKLI